MRQDNMSALSGLASFAQLQSLLTARHHEGCAEAKMTFEAFEVELGQAVRGLENELKAADLARYDVEADAVMVDGKEWRKCLEQQPQTYLSASGPVTVARNLYRPADGGKCICPLELRAGIIGGLYTPVLARQVSYLMGHMTSDETSTFFTELGISGPSSSSCDRLPKLLSAVWESNRESWEDALRQQEVVPAEASVVAVSLDGVMVPDKDAQREAKAQREAAKKQGLAKQLSGPAGYREVGCGTVTLYDEDAQRLDTVRYGRAPEAKKKTLTAQLDAELASILAVRPDLEVVALADGAEENWRYFERPVYENATKIVDHGHASQHLRAAMAAYYGEKTVTGRAEYERLRIILRDHPGGADDVIAETTYGRIRGTDLGGVKVFKGVPYGASTTGRNRFMPPVAPAKWAGVRDALAYGPSAPQTQPGASRTASTCSWRRRSSSRGSTSPTPTPSSSTTRTVSSSRGLAAMPKPRGAAATSARPPA